VVETSVDKPEQHSCNCIARLLLLAVEHFVVLLRGESQFRDFSFYIRKGEVPLPSSVRTRRIPQMPQQSSTAFIPPADRHLTYNGDPRK